MKRTIVINPDYQQLTDFIHRLPEIFLDEGEYIHDGRNKIKVFEVNGIRLNVKRYRIPILPNRLVYAFLREPKAVRAYNNAKILLQKQINTPTPVGYILEQSGLLFGYSYFISLQVNYSRRFYEFGKLSVLHQDIPILEAFGYFTARMHDLGVYHLDYSPGNILFDVYDGKPEFCIVDINRMRFGKVSLKQGCANFSRLWGSRLILLFIGNGYTDYFLDYPKSEVLGYMEEYWKKYWRKAYKKGRIEFPFSVANLRDVK